MMRKIENPGRSAAGPGREGHDACCAVAARKAVHWAEGRKALEQQLKREVLAIKVLEKHEVREDPT